MTQTDDNKPPQPSVALDYGKPDSMWPAWCRRLWAEIVERVDGTLEFLGLLTYYLGGLRRVVLAIGMACAGWGLGLSLDQNLVTDGPRWMCLGGFLVGLMLPAAAKRDSK